MVDHRAKALAGSTRCAAEEEVGHGRHPARREGRQGQRWGPGAARAGAGRGRPPGAVAGGGRPRRRRQGAGAAAAVRAPVLDGAAGAAGAQLGAVGAAGPAPRTDRGALHAVPGPGGGGQRRLGHRDRGRHRRPVQEPGPGSRGRPDPGGDPVQHPPALLRRRRQPVGAADRAQRGGLGRAAAGAVAAGAGAARLRPHPAAGRPVRAAGPAGRGGAAAAGALGGFGRSRARRYEPETGRRTTFADVAGIDEVEDEVAEIVDFLKQPRPLPAAGGDGPQGGAAGRAARDRQDPARPGRGRRGRRAVLLRVGLGVHRVHRRRRAPAGSGTCSRRPRPTPRRSSSSTSWTPSAGPAAGRSVWAATTSASRPSTRS